MGAWLLIALLVFAFVGLVVLMIHERGVDKAHAARRVEFAEGSRKLEEQLERLDREEDA